MMGTEVPTASRTVSSASTISRGWRIVSITEHIDPALGQCLGLLFERCSHALEVALNTFEDEPARADRTRHVGVVPGRFSRNLDRREIDFAHLPFEAVTREPDGVGAERVGLDDVGPGTHEVFVHLADDLGAGKVELFVVEREELAPLVELRAHAPIADEDTTLECIDKRRAPTLRIGHGAA